MDYNQAVITTKFVIESGSKIVYVYHSKEGWQFFGKEKSIKESDSRIVSLERIILLNPSIKDILWITEGMEAWKNNDDQDWQMGISNIG